MRIMSNIPALQSFNALTVTNNALAKSIERLSTGLRINSAADDAAGLAISEKMRSQIRGLNQAVMNAQNGISMVQTAEGALGETHAMLQRMRELAVQAANDTLTQEDRSYIQLEINQLKDEITRVATTTQFNKKRLLDGSAAVLWSASDLSTKAIIKGGLRQVDQFGQKMAMEGNFKISVTATPGQAEIQKSDIFKIKHKNVIMGLRPIAEAGIAGVRIDNMPAGEYTVRQMAPPATAGWAEDTQQVFGTSGGLRLAAGTEPNPNASVLFEVISVNTTMGTVTFKIQSNVLYTNGIAQSFSVNELTLNADGIVGKPESYSAFGIKLAYSDLRLNIQDPSAVPPQVYAIGDKVVANFVAVADNRTEGGATAARGVEGKIHNPKVWPDGWYADPDTNPPTPAIISATYGLNAAHLANLKSDVQFNNFYLNPLNGTVYQGSVVISFNGNFKPTGDGDNETPAGEILASFEAAFVGQVAKGDVKLRDIDRFWDTNGRFMLDNPQEITLTQGDGTNTKITLYATDTMEDLRYKLNEAIAYGLGQSRYSVSGAANFVSFVETTSPGHESVAGTLVIRSLIPGNDGKITFSGDEELIRAFSLNVIQQSVENTFSVSIQDAHTLTSVASNVKISGNLLVGVIHPNVDVIFDPMANIEATWNSTTRKFDLRNKDETRYETILHLSDNTTIFQVGANEGEDMGLDIGDMSARALGILSVVVTDRESAARSITTIDLAISRVSSQRAKLGAYQNRLEHTISNLTTAAMNTTAAESRIRDVDMAREMMEFTKLNILSQAGTSMLAQANQIPQNVLALLR